MDESGGERLRADARRNRERVVAAARALFAEQGAKAPMEEVARRADVGVGTLYRRFPDRESLVIAVCADTMRRMADAAHTAAELEPDGRSALTRFLREYGNLNLGALYAAIDPELHDRIRRDPDVTRGRGALADRLGAIVERARSEGSLRPDAGFGDIAMLFSMHLHLPAGMDPEAASTARSRLVELVIAGLMTDGAPPRLPGRAMPAEHE